MNKLLAAALAALALTASAAQAADPLPRDEGDDHGGVKIGMLSCEIGGGVGFVLGSAKELNCDFRSTTGRRIHESYTGTIRKLGVDVGFTSQGKLVWAVVAPTAGYHRGSLAGVYQGATAEASLGLGAGVNVLVGGTTGSIGLQTISVDGLVGLNLAATGTSVTLEPAG